ncbi:hypothetical protein [Brevibacillus massiliensis]|jgi:hypothetical protein|uniref:hypothetical protein n=1 Tax=Brevibacillus massiliensis TaxID=1118054 RepID=UPI00036969B9|nr:hypothetical protein [Brevibacillus massiliensis]
MRVIFHECKKVFSSPLLIALIVLFSAFNLFIIWNESYRLDELKVANELAETYGLQITDKSLRQFEEDVKTDLAGLHGAPAPVDLQRKGMYLQMAKSIDSKYDEIDWNKIGEREVHKYKLSGSAAEILKKAYNKLSRRFEEIKETDEHKTWFFSGKPYRMYGFLFASLFRPIIFETLMLIVLATALITNYEFENKTCLVAYSTRRGRSLMKDKLAASLLTTAGIVTVILALTLGVYFAVFDYSHLWGSAISSAFNWEYSMDDLPYVSWWNLSFAEYLLCSILLLYVCMLLFSAISFAISVLVKNSYYTFFLFAAFFIIALLTPGFASVSSALIFITVHNLSVLCMNPHMWFMGNGGLTMFKNYELVTAGVWTVITSTLCLYALSRFKKQELY